MMGEFFDRLGEKLKSRNFAEWHYQALADRIQSIASGAVPAPPASPIPPLTYTLTPDQLRQLNDAALIHEAMSRGYAVTRIREPNDGKTDR